MVVAYHEGEAGGLARSGRAHAGSGGQGRGRRAVTANDGGGKGTQLGTEITPLPLHLRHQSLDLPQKQVVLPPCRCHFFLLVPVHPRHTGCVQSSFIMLLCKCCKLDAYSSWPVHHPEHYPPFLALLHRPDTPIYLLVKVKSLPTEARSSLSPELYCSSLIIIIRKLM